MFLSLTAGDIQPVYLLRLQFPLSITETPGLAGSYKGHPLDLKEHWCLLPENNEVFTFSLIITPEVSFKAQGNNVRYLKLIEHVPCLWYDLTLYYETEPSTGRMLPRWEIRQRTSSEMPSRIPDKAIVIYMNPQLVEGVVAPEVDENNENNHVVTIPMVVFKKNITADDFAEAGVYPLLASLDIKPILRATKKR